MYRRILGVLCAIALVQTSMMSCLIAYGESAPSLPPAKSGQVESWDNSMFSEDVVLDGSGITKGKVTMLNGSMLILQGGHFAVAPGALFEGDILLAGDGSSLDVGGEVNGNIRITSATGSITITGSVNGIVSVDNISHRDEPLTDVQLILSDTGYITTLSLAGKGIATLRGSVDTLDTSPDNAVMIAAKGASIGDLYLRSAAGCELFDQTKVNTIYIDGKGGRVGNECIVDISLFYGSSAKEIIMDAGFLDLFDGSTIGTLRMNGSSIADIGVDISDNLGTHKKITNLNPPAIDKLIQKGEGGFITCNGGRINYCYIENGYFQNAGQVETLVLKDADCRITKYPDLDDVGLGDYKEAYGKLFSYNNGTIITSDSYLYMGQESVVGDLFIQRGTIETEDVSIGTQVIEGEGRRTQGYIGEGTDLETLVILDEEYPDLRTDRIVRGLIRKDAVGNYQPQLLDGDVYQPLSAGKEQNEPLAVTPGNYLVEGKTGSQWLSVNADAYTALKLAFNAYGGYGYALVITPDGEYHFLDLSDGEQSLSLMNETAGTYLIRLIGTDSTNAFTLKVQADYPLMINYTLTERMAAEAGKKAEVKPGSLQDYSITLFDQTTQSNISDVQFGNGILYAMPSAAAPGDTIMATIQKKDGSIPAYTVTFPLNQRRYAQADFQGAARGLYQAEVADTKNLHLYLYDEKGIYLTEVFQQSGVYTIDSLPNGSYSAVYIRAGAGGWKLLHLEDFAKNGLVAGEHYTLDSFHIDNGLLVTRKSVNIPKEPGIHSDWLDTAGTGYKAYVNSVVKGGLVLMTLDWAITREDAGELKANVQFQPGAAYVEGSASLASKPVDCTWANGTLTVPLKGFQGRLQFYVQGNGSSDVLISNAFIEFTAQGQVHTQYIGSAQTQIVPLSVYGPSLTHQDTIRVYGYGQPYSVVSLYDNQVLSGNVLTDGNGFWTAQLALSRQREHSITVGTEDGDALSEPIQLLRVIGAPQLEQFALYYTEHGVSKQILIAGEEFGSRTIKFAYEPGTDLTFVLDVSNDQYLDSLSVIGIMNGQRETIKAKRDAKNGNWVAVGRFTSDQMFAPDTFALEYSFRDDELEQAYRQPYESVPMMEVLYSVTDLEGELSLKRYYMASPTLQQTNFGFGQGWMTEYSIFAGPLSYSGKSGVYVWSPEGRRVFYSEKGKYTEAYGYATAKKDAKGGIVVTEANGAAMTFAPDGRLTQTKDAYGNKTSFSYNDQRQLVSVKRWNSELTITYQNGLAQFASLGEERLSYQYSKDHLTRAEGPNGHGTYAYDQLIAGAGGTHALVSATDWAGSALFRYNDLGYPVRIEHNDTVTDIAYGKNQVSFAQKGITVTYTIDGEGQIIAAESSTGSTETIIHDEDRTVLKSKDAAGAVSEILYNRGGKPLEMTDANGHKTLFDYNAKGWLTKVTDANGNVTAYGYNKTCNLTGITYADGTSEKYTYDKKGQLTAYTDRSGGTTAYEYDSDGQMVKATYPDKATAEYRYDEQGNLAEVKEGSLSSFNDIQPNRSRYYSITDEDGIYYETDNHNILTYMDYQGHNVSYHYSSTRQLTGVSNNDGNVSEITYNEMGFVKRETRGNGTYATYAYDEQNRLIRMENCAADGGIQSFFALEYDAAGNIVQYSTIEGTWQYGYDDARQLTKTVDPAGNITQYAYDPAGNRVSKTVNGQVTVYEVNRLNQYTRIGDTQYEYDKNGLLVKSYGTDGETLYGWDVRQRLICVEKNGQKTEYGYDLYGNRRSVTVNGITTKYIAVDSDLPYIVASTTSDQPTIYYDYGANGLVASHHEGVTLYYNYNPLGSVSDITDASGNLIRHYVYGPEGSLLSETVPGSEAVQALDADAGMALEAAVQVSQNNPFKYVGRYGIMDDGNGLWFMRARYTDQETGRFISADSAGQNYDVNLYRYANNNTVSFVDYTGFDSISVGSGSQNYGQNSGSNGKQAPVPPGNKSGGSGGSGGNGSDSIFGERGESWTDPSKSGSSIDVTYALGLLGLTVGIVTLGPLVAAAIAAAGITVAPAAVCTVMAVSAAGLVVMAGGTLVTVPGNAVSAATLGSSSSQVRIDPSGYVYEAVVSNRVEGVTATLYTRQDGTSTLWNAAEFEQVNPQITDALGQYAWYVPAGEWKVVYEKLGYEPLETKWLPVPPPQTEVNVELLSYEAPVIRHAALYTDAAEVTFSKYMDIQSVQANLLLKDGSGADLPATVTPLNPEASAADKTHILASRFSLATGKGLPEQAVVTLSTGAVSYSGTAAKAQEVSLDRTWRLTSLGLKESYTLLPNTTQTIALHATGEGHFNTLQISAQASDMAGVTVDDVSELNTKGKGTITVTTQGAGKSTLRVYDMNTGYEATVLLTIAPNKGK